MLNTITKNAKITFRQGQVLVFESAVRGEICNNTMNDDDAAKDDNHLNENLQQ
jgi:hypothetical protein